jgi:hypothetical protein
MSYSGTIDIMHDKARFYTGNTLAANAQKLSQEEIQARRDEHGNYIGVTEEERVHYHGSLQKGQNTVNACVARLAMRYIAETNAGQKDLYDPDEFLERFVEYMKGKPDPIDDKDQLISHNDTYMDIYVRHFFEMASKGTRLRDCPKNQRDVRIESQLFVSSRFTKFTLLFTHSLTYYIITRTPTHPCMVNGIAAMEYWFSGWRGHEHSHHGRLCQ